MSNERPRVATLAEVVREESRRLLLSLHVLKPGRVVAYDAATRTCEVLPLFKTVYRGENDKEATLEPTPIPAVPVWWWRAGGWEIVGELVPGDIVGLMFADRSLDPFLSRPPPTDDAPAPTFDPVVARAHDLSDAIAVPGMMLTQVGAAADRPLILRHLSGLLEIEVGHDGSIALRAGGAGGMQRAVRGDELVQWLVGHTHLDALGGTGPPAAPPPDSVLSTLITLR